MWRLIILYLAIIVVFCFIALVIVVAINNKNETSNALKEYDTKYFLFLFIKSFLIFIVLQIGAHHFFNYLRIIDEDVQHIGPLLQEMFYEFCINPAILFGMYANFETKRKKLYKYSIFKVFPHFLVITGTYILVLLFFIFIAKI